MEISVLKLKISILGKTEKNKAKLYNLAQVV